MKFLFAPFIIKATASILAVFSMFIATDLMANNCTKSDIDYYLQRGFSHDQVLQLCGAAPAPNQVQYRGGTYAPPNPQMTALREDQIYLETALDAKNVKITPQNLTYSSKECAEFGPPNNPDLIEEACVTSRVTINFAGLQVIKTSTGLFLVKDAEFIVRGNIQREYLDLASVRRQEKSEVLRLLPNTPKEVNIPVRRGIDPKQVAAKFSKYIK